MGDLGGVPKFTSVVKYFVESVLTEHEFDEVFSLRCLALLLLNPPILRDFKTGVAVRDSVTKAERFIELTFF
jgi:hypothetical protein